MVLPLDLLYSHMANHASELSLEHLWIKMIELHLKHRQQQLGNLHQMHDIPKTNKVIEQCLSSHHQNVITSIYRLPM